RSVGIPSTQQLGRATSSLFFRTLPDRPKRVLFVSPEHMRTHAAAWSCDWLTLLRTLPDRPKRALFVSPERMRTIWHLRAAVFKQKNTNHTRFSDNRKIGPHFPIIGK
ncbi:MAG: hypothetical protein MJE77_37910, partial [Proteobacteria bacterium]|nr:hypothetical protein [Pseudomonadota bacterium]